MLQTKAPEDYAKISQSRRRPLLGDCKISRNLRKGSFEALLGAARGVDPVTEEVMEQFAFSVNHALAIVHVADLIHSDTREIFYLPFLNSCI